MGHAVARADESTSGRAFPQRASLGQSQVFGLLASIVDQPAYPCLGAHSVFRRERATIGMFGELGTRASAAALLEHLAEFSAVTGQRAGLASFVAGFEGPVIASETHFEALLWQQLQLIHDADGEGWNAEVSDDPADKRFAFSAADAAFFVVGLHPSASRLARRFPIPVLVFNPHAQFEELRQAGRYTRMRDAIRIRDERFQGCCNPMVSDHGVSSEARQYSGRAVSEAWIAPFQARTVRDR